MSRALKSPPITAIHRACHMTRPTRSSRPAPWYWAEKVLTYPAVLTKALMVAKLSMPAGMDAATEFDECQARNIRLTKVWIDQEPVERIGGRPAPAPAGTRHRCSTCVGSRIGRLGPSSQK